MTSPFIYCVLIWIVVLSPCWCRAGDHVEFQPNEAYRKYTPQQNLALKEAPMLAELVAQGELPPVEKRLPDYPMVVPVVDELGYYGGTWRKYHVAASKVNVGMESMRLLNNYYPLTRWSPEVDGIIPGIAESWESSPDGKQFTFHLRKNLKWSDGIPLTSRDILFWWELCLDERVFIITPEWAYTDGRRMKVTTPNPNTVVFTYEEPFYFLPMIMATGFWVPESMFVPFHYMKEFHPDYDPKYKDFNEFLTKNNTFNNPDRPTLAPWRLVYYSKTGDKAIYERNPYYYGVDPQGRQLPYINRIESIRVQSHETGVLLAISGAVDAQFRGVNLKDYALLKRFEKRGNYRIHAWEKGSSAWHAVFINWSVANPERRKLFRNKNFRRALAVAVNRERINQVVWNGLARPQAAAITDESWHFQSPRGQSVLKRWIMEWAQFDPNLANELLDHAGLMQRDEKGFRTYNDKPLRILLEFFDDPIAADEALLIKEDWQNVGIRTLIKLSTGTDLWGRINTGDYDMYMQHCSEMDIFTFPDYVFPTGPKSWHPRIGKWYERAGKEGEAPEGFMATLIDIYEQCKREPNLQKRHSLVLDAIDIQLEEGPFMIGTCGRQKSLVILKEYFRNVPKMGILGPWAICQPASKFPEQFYYEKFHLYGANK